MCRCSDDDDLVAMRRRKKLKMGVITVRLEMSATSAPLPDTLGLRIEENEVDSPPAFVSLHRRGGEASFASGKSVAAGEGATLEVFLRDVKLLQGILRRSSDGASDRWVLEFASLCSSEIQLTLSAEGHVAVRQVRNKARRRRFEGLQRIPEEETETACECGVVGSDGGDLRIEMEGVGWAVDVAIWVVSLGLGLLVSKASSKALRPTRLL